MAGLRPERGIACSIIISVRFVAGLIPGTERFHNMRALFVLQTIPFIALQVSAEALRRLNGSSKVVLIGEDRVVPPQTSRP